MGVAKSGWGHLVHEALKFAEWVYVLSWFFACWLCWNNFWLDKPCICFTFLPVRPLAVARRILLNRVCPSLFPAISVGVFLELDYYISLDFGMVLETLVKLSMITQYFGKKKNYYLLFLDKFYIWEKSCSWDIGKSALNQSDYRIFKSSIFSELIDETASFLACWYKLTKIESYLKFFLIGHGQKWVLPIWSLDSKTDCISRIRWWN